MRTKFLALLAGIAMTSGVGMTQAADMAPVKTDTVVATAEPLQTRGPTVLTNKQMDKVAAGHLIGPGLNFRHWGPYLKEFRVVFSSVWLPQVSWHTD
jgi:hypothetical protein